MANGTSYAVTVATQPASLRQTCTVTNGSGVVNGANVTNVAVSCVTNRYTIGGTVSGLTGMNLVLQNNGGDNRGIGGNGAFTFATSIADGSAYSVSILNPPNLPEQVCTVTNGNGTVNGANVTNVSVVCWLRCTLRVRGQYK